MEGSYSDGIHRLQDLLTSARARRDMQGLSLGLATLADWMLELDRPEEADAPAQDAAELLRQGGSWQPWPEFAFGPLAETVVRLGTPDAEDVLAEAEQQVESSEQYLGRPQLLRARGLLCERKGKLNRALEALHASAEVARSQRAVIQLGRTLPILAKVARVRRDAALAAKAGAELAALVARVGPEVRGLVWASGLPGLSRRSTSADAGRLTSREREVAALIVDGRSNRQIAGAPLPKKRALSCPATTWCPRPRIRPPER
jgi:hypothetical protein